ncbi:MmcQ/YjbR family DNA-binding protein [Aestuariivirga sp.]|uniref:MmcQ/YjbR family DNA-binding protein n=1 Tax=Aestuariivirga sp. TaxID=2650926 RepID=UPI0039E2CA06
MAKAADLQRIALSLEGTEEHPHFDRAAYKARIIYVTLAPDGKSANFRFTPEDQALKCTVAPEAFSPVPGGWGRMGYTTGLLAKLTLAELEAALRLAWEGARQKPAKRRGKSA